MTVIRLQLPMKPKTCFTIYAVGLLINVRAYLGNLLD